MRWNRALGKNLKPTRAVTSERIGPFFARSPYRGEKLKTPAAPIGLVLEIQKSHPNERCGKWVDVAIRFVLQPSSFPLPAVFWVANIDFENQERPADETVQ